MSEANSLPPLESVTVANATAVLAQGVAAIRGGQRVIDLGGIKAVDSSAVAVLLAWQRAARDAGSTLSFTNIPANLCSLTTLYGVESFVTDSDGCAAAAPHRH
jgi:phospholipid transport system transporter-binding protein